MDSFTAAFVRSILDNPVYCGKLAYGCRHNEKIPGTRNQCHIVKQDEYMLYDGAHEAIISETDIIDAEKKEFIKSFIEKVEIYPEKLPNGRFLKRIEFCFPVFFDGQAVDGLSWDSESTVECAALLEA